MFYNTNIINNSVYFAMLNASQSYLAVKQTGLIVITSGSGA